MTCNDPMCVIATTAMRDVWVVHERAFTASMLVTRDDLVCAIATGTVRDGDICSGFEKYM